MTEDQEKYLAELREAFDVVTATQWGDESPLWKAFFDKYSKQPHHTFEEAARILEQALPLLWEMAEARGKATEGEWKMIFSSSNSRAVRADNGILFNAWQPFRYTGQDDRYDEELTETKSNCEFIATAANNTRKLKEILP